MGTIKGYKGFNTDLKCRGFQYEIGKEYTQEGTIECCENGFHFCESPLSVLGYYRPTDSRYCEVEGSGEIDREGDKVAVSHIKIGKEIGLSDLINAAIKFIHDKIKGGEALVTHCNDYSAVVNSHDCSAVINRGDNSIAANTGFHSIATNTGIFSVAANTGCYSVATSSGEYSLATNTGSYSASVNAGRHSVAINTGHCSIVTNTGHCSIVTNFGCRSVATTIGEDSVATNNGDYSEAKVTGNGSLAIVTGKGCKAAGEMGCWLVLTERNMYHDITDMKCVKVDGETIKPNTYYMLKGGKIVEVED